MGQTVNSGKHPISWRGVARPISSDPVFSLFFSIVKTHISYGTSRLYLTDAAGCTLFGLTPVKYECDITNKTGTFTRPKILHTKALANGAFLTPTPGTRGVFGCIYQPCYVDTPSYNPWYYSSPKFGKALTACHWKRDVWKRRFPWSVAYQRNVPNSISSSSSVITFAKPFRITSVRNKYKISSALLKPVAPFY